MTGDRESLLSGYDFDLDGFQLRALDALDAGESVLVAAPTGSGKTVVAEYAVSMALAEGKRAFYTTPIKALSNQKYLDLVARHGAERVGLLTGDNAINGDAPVVVMTTEVLRNMIYARSSGLDALAVVVLDEVHFLQDTYRGPVWEEVIIHLAYHVRLVCLSATVSNAEELADWMRTVRGPTTVVLETKRPVELHQLHLVGDRTSERFHVLPTLVDGRPNPEAMRLDEESARGPKWMAYKNKARRKLYTPSRIDVVDLLDEREMLPAIYFIFSRNACDDAAGVCLDAGLRLTTASERDRIRQIIEARLGSLPGADLAVLGYARFRAGLENGIASHHAGMIPPFKEVVETCFTEGLVKIVFATETLAVGINMPARTVVIEKLTKYTGERHEFLSPSSYTQLTGRAGRRGIDTSGNAITLWSPFVTFEQVASLAASRSFNLQSAFRPTYNMAANLVRSYGAERAHQLLNLSFAQYQADGDIVRIEARLERRSHVLAELRAAAVSPFGDIDDYLASTNREERRLKPVRPSGQTIDLAMLRLKPGDIFLLNKGRHAGRVGVLTVANRGQGSMKLKVITPNRILLTLSAPDFDETPKVVGHVELPTPFQPNRQSYQREVARAVDRAKIGVEFERLEREVRGELDEPDRFRHPVEDDPDLAARLKAAAQRDRVQREVDELRDRVRGRSESLARRFDRVLALLEEWGYLSASEWSLSEHGDRLARLFHESDLLVAESMRRGLFDGLDAASFCALASVFVYEHRSSDQPPPPWFPSAKVRKRWLAIDELATELNAREDLDRLPLTRRPDPTFVAVAYAWAAGEAFAEVVGDEEMSGGDFVRTTKQLIDLVRQLGDLAPLPATARVARQAAEALFRGVVAASSTVETGS